MSAAKLNRKHDPASAAVLAFPQEADAKHATPIRRLWLEAQRLEGALCAHRADIDEAEALRLGATPGWLCLGPDTLSAGEERYQVLIAILNETPRDAGDLALMARAAEDHDIRRGPAGWAAARVAAAASLLS